MFSHVTHIDIYSLANEALSLLFFVSFYSANEFVSLKWSTGANRNFHAAKKNQSQAHCVWVNHFTEWQNKDRQRLDKRWRKRPKKEEEKEEKKCHRISVVKESVGDFINLIITNNGIEARKRMCQMDIFAVRFFRVAFLLRLAPYNFLLCVVVRFAFYFSFFFVLLFQSFAIDSIVAHFRCLLCCLFRRCHSVLHRNIKSTHANRSSLMMTRQIFQLSSALLGQIFDENFSTVKNQSAMKTCWKWEQEKNFWWINWFSLRFSVVYRIIARR